MVTQLETLPLRPLAPRWHNRGPTRRIVQQERPEKLSTTEIACHSTPEQAGLRVETIPFDQIPQQTRLFLDYLHDPTALRRFYPEAVRFHYEVSQRRDHVLAEVATAEIINRDCVLSSVSVPAEVHPDGLPVGRVVLDETIETSIQSLLAALPKTEFNDDLEKLLRAAYQPGRKFGDAFARMMTALIGEQGLILLDPLDPQLKQVAAPLYADAARRAHDIALAIVNRSHELEEAGYHAQVAPSENSFPLFWHDDNGARHALTRNEHGKYQAKGPGQAPDPGAPSRAARLGSGGEGGLDSNAEFTADELAEWALREPDRFSPNVTL